MFTKEQLEKMDRDKLKDLASYLDVQFYPRIRTNKLIDLILSALNPVPESESTPRYSVRVKRIMDQKAKEGL